MGFFDRFKKKKEVEYIEDIDIVEPVFSNEVEDGICDYCGISIFNNQKKKTFNGKKYHLLCSRKLFKEGKKLVFN